MKPAVLGRMLNSQNEGFLFLKMTSQLRPTEPSGLLAHLIQSKCYASRLFDAGRRVGG